MNEIVSLVNDYNGYAVAFSTFTFDSRKRNKIIDKYHRTFGNQFFSDISYILGRLTSSNGFYSIFSTKQLINELQKFDPDIIHLHNIHDFCFNIPLLFNYFKTTRAKIVWTLHDCWSFTGHCAHFQMSGCDRWITGCHDCPSYKNYPKTFFDNSRRMYIKKREYFTGLKNMIIVTPSKWLADLVTCSYLKDYPIRTINNGIDLSVFKPTESSFRIKHNLQNKKLVLGVSFSWGKSKGLDVFIDLAEKLPNEYKIVLVGTNSEIDKILPENILSIHKTEDQYELAGIYSSADVFFNPTREDTFPTVNIEAIACGTPVLTFKTGGSPEIIDEKCGMCIASEQEISNTIVSIIERKMFKESDCVRRAAKFNKFDRYKDYINLFSELVKG